MVQRMIEKNKEKKQKKTGQRIKQTSNNQTSIKKKKQNKTKNKNKKSTNRNHPLMSKEIFETSYNMKLGLPRPGTESYRSD